MRALVQASFYQPGGSHPGTFGSQTACRGVGGMRSEPDGEKKCGKMRKKCGKMRSKIWDLEKSPICPDSGQGTGGKKNAVRIFPHFFCIFSKIPG